MSDDRHRRIAVAAEETARDIGLQVQVAVRDEVPLLVGPSTVAKGQATEDAPPVERPQTVVIFDSNYLLTLFPGRYVVFQLDPEGKWRRRKTPRRDHYKNLRQALADVFEGIIWDRLKPLRDRLTDIDFHLLSTSSNHAIKGYLSIEKPPPIVSMIPRNREEESKEPYISNDSAHPVPVEHVEDPSQERPEANSRQKPAPPREDLGPVQPEPELPRPDLVPVPQAEGEVPPLRERNAGRSTPPIRRPAQPRSN